MLGLKVIATMSSLKIFFLNQQYKLFFLPGLTMVFPGPMVVFPGPLLTALPKLRLSKDRIKIAVAI